MRSDSGHSTPDHRIELHYRLIPRTDGSLLDDFLLFHDTHTQRHQNRKEEKKKSPQDNYCMSYGGSSRVYFAACMFAISDL